MANNAAPQMPQPKQRREKASPKNTNIYIHRVSSNYGLSNCFIISFASQSLLYFWEDSARTAVQMAATEALAEWVAQEREERKLKTNEHACQPCKAADRSIKTLIWFNAIIAFFGLTMTISAITYGTLIYQVQSQANNIAHTQLHFSNQIGLVSLCLADNNETIDKALCDSFVKIFNSRLQNMTADSHKTAAEPILPPPTEQIPFPAPSKPSPKNNPDPVSEPATQPASRKEKIVNNIILVLGISAMLTVYFLLLYRLGKIDD